MFSRPEFCDRAIQHWRSEVGQDRHPNSRALQQLQCRRHIRPRLDLQIRLHELFALAPAEVEFQQLCAEDQRIVRHVPEVCVTTRQGSQPCIFELPRAPRIAKLRPFPREELLCKYEDRSRIKDREAVEGDGFDSSRCCGFGERVRRHKAGHGACGGHAEKFSAIESHVSLLRTGRAPTTRASGRDGGHLRPGGASELADPTRRVRHGFSRGTRGWRSRFPGHASPGRSDRCRSAAHPHLVRRA